MPATPTPKLATEDTATRTPVFWLSRESDVSGVIGAGSLVLASGVSMVGRFVLGVALVLASGACGVEFTALFW